MGPCEAGGPGPELELGEGEFNRLRDLIRLASGIALGDSKRALVESRLRGRVRELGLGGFGAYCDLLVDERSGEVGRLINAVTTNLTSFFRERHHFDTLRRWLAGRGGEPARIWSAACSTGEEPYSIAIASAIAGRPETRILGTDVDTSVLAAAREAVYREEAIRGLPVQVRRFGFLRGRGGHKGLVRIKDELREMVRLAPLNLAAAEWPLKRPMDAIFCRNVLIYFDPDMQRAVVDRLVGRLAPGGLLFLGHAESQAGRHDLLEPAGVTAYRRLDGPSPVSLAEVGAAGKGRYE